MMVYKTIKGTTEKFQIWRAVLTYHQPKKSSHSRFVFDFYRLRLKTTKQKDCNKTVNAPLVSLQSKSTNNTKSEVRFKQLIRDL
jgi:hypothetical protein